MRIELAGLPGCGKTTLRKGLLAALRDSGQEAEKFEALSWRRRGQVQQVSRMLGRKPERTEIYGLAQFAAAHPATFRILHEGAEHTPDRMIWTMLFLSNAWFALQDMPDLPVVQEEGFVQYGMAALAKAPEETARAYGAAIPPPGLVIVPDIGIETVMARTAGNDNMLPADLRRMGPGKLERAFRRRVAALDTVCAALEGRGVPVLRLDATDPPEALARAACGAVLAHLGPWRAAFARVAAEMPPRAAGEDGRDADRMGEDRSDED